MKLINADMVVHWEAYDDEHESFTRHSGTIAEFLDQMTDEGCPETVDAVPVRYGHWIEDPDDWECQCSECGHLSSCRTVYCSACGARMYGKGDANG